MLEGSDDCDALRVQRRSLSKALFILMIIVFFISICPCTWFIASRTNPREKLIFLRDSIDHEAVREASLQLQKDIINAGEATSSDWKRLLRTDPRIPTILRELDPVCIDVTVNSVRIELGGSFGHYGLAVFKTEFNEYGDRKIKDRMWLYCDSYRLHFPEEFYGEENAKHQ